MHVNVKLSKSCEWGRPFSFDVMNLGRTGIVKPFEMFNRRHQMNCVNENEMLKIYFGCL